jgi:cyclin B/cyclin A
MIDWTFQVFRVLKREADGTFFKAIDIADRFFNKTNGMSQRDLHLYGLVSCFIASKLEELYPIRMEQVLFEAGHGKFSHTEILEAERKVYQVLEYRLLTETLHDQVFRLFEQALAAQRVQVLDKA